MNRPDRRHRLLSLALCAVTALACDEKWPTEPDRQPILPAEFVVRVVSIGAGHDDDGFLLTFPRENAPSGDLNPLLVPPGDSVELRHRTPPNYYAEIGVGGLDPLCVLGGDPLDAGYLLGSGDVVELDLTLDCA